MLNFCVVCDRLEMVLHQNTAFSNTKQTGLSYEDRLARLPLCDNTFFFHFIGKDYLTINCHSSQI